MKVLLINSVCGIKSTGRICTDLHDVLVQNGNECKIAYGREIVPEKYENDSIRIGNNSDVYWHAMSSRAFDNSGFGSKNATNEFIHWIDSYKPDIIHLHNLHGYYINIKILFDYLKSTNIPIIWTLHDCWSFTGHCTHFDYIQCDRWRTEECQHCPQKKEYPSSYICDNSSKNIKTKKRIFTGLKNLIIVTPSNWLKRLVGKSFLNTYPVEVIPNGIDLNVFKPTSSSFRENNQLQDKKILLGVASIWSKRKGFEDFIKLAYKLNESYSIVLVGLDKKQIASLPKGIIGVSKTNNVKELAEIYSTADIFINPTYEDNFPTVNLEALACGTPVITYDTGGSPESLNNKCGVVVKANPDNIAEVLKIINFNSHECRERAMKFDKDIQFMKYHNLYLNVLNK